MNYEASNPADYPVGELVKKLPDDVRAWVLAQSLDTKSSQELLCGVSRIAKKVNSWEIYT